MQIIENPLDALEAYLKNKTLLVDLTLRWGKNGNSIDSKKEDDVIENLQPYKNLKELSIFKYGGKQLPDWLLENSLSIFSMLCNRVGVPLKCCHYFYSSPFKKQKKKIHCGIWCL